MTKYSTYPEDLLRESAFCFIPAAPIANYLDTIKTTNPSMTTDHMGTWKLNEAKSKFAPGAAKNHTVVYEAAGDQIKVTVDGTDSAGTATHNEWTGKFDGKDYALVGDPTADMRSYRRIGARTLALTGKKAGKGAPAGA